MKRPPPLSLRTDTLVPYTTRFRSRSEVIGLHCGITYDACREDERGVTVCVEDERRRHELKAERLLVATGRTPNTEALELPYAGVAQDARGAKIGRAHV